MSNKCAGTWKDDYPLIPMSKITDEARELAKAWYDGVSEMNDIKEKHKLASDIMNYARRHSQPESKEDMQDAGYLKQLAEAAGEVIACIPDRKDNLYELGFHQAMKKYKSIKQQSK